jgi:hypothetical protein
VDVYEVICKIVHLTVQTLSYVNRSTSGPLRPPSRSAELEVGRKWATPWREFSALGRAPLKMDVTGFFHERKYKYSRVSRAPSRDLGILAHSACLLRFHARRSRGVHDSLSRTQFAFQPAAQIDVASSAASHFSGRRCN